MGHLSIKYVVSHIGFLISQLFNNYKDLLVFLNAMIMLKKYETYERLAFSNS